MFRSDNYSIAILNTNVLLILPYDIPFKKETVKYITEKNKSVTQLAGEVGV